jgi:hypothetical protein
MATVVGGDRFCLFFGRSGRRHVFSRLDGELDPADLTGAVVLIAGRGDAPPLWVGEGDDVPPAGFAGTAAVFAHFLAETAAERRAVIVDLAAGETRVRRLG